MFHHLFFKNIVTRTTNGSECLTALPLNCGGSLIKMGNKIKIPSDWERRRELLNILQPWLTSETFVLPSCICLTAIHHRLWLWKYWIFAMDIEKLYGHIYMIMLEYGWVPEVRDSYRFISKVKPLLFQRSRYQTLFQSSDTVPDSLMLDIGPSY